MKPEDVPADLVEKVVAMRWTHRSHEPTPKWLLEAIREDLAAVLPLYGATVLEEVRTEVVRQVGWGRVADIVTRLIDRHREGSQS